MQRLTAFRKALTTVNPLTWEHHGTRASRTPCAIRCCLSLSCHETPSSPVLAKGHDAYVQGRIEACVGTDSGCYLLFKGKIAGNR